MAISPAAHPPDLNLVKKEVQPFYASVFQNGSNGGTCSFLFIRIRCITWSCVYSRGISRDP